MTAFGPTIVGGAGANNANHVTIRPSVTVPVGSFLFVAGSMSMPDTTTVTVTDSVGNGGAGGYNQQVESEDPNNLNHTVFAFWIMTTIAIPTSGSITINFSSAGKSEVGSCFFGGARGNLLASDVEWMTNVANGPPKINSGPFLGNLLGSQLSLPAGTDCLALLGVNGPTTDTFTQDSNWSSDIGAGLSSTNFSVHGGGIKLDTAGPVTYSPSMGTARNSVGILLAFN